jgi:hypothetical protein
MHISTKTHWATVTTGGIQTSILKRQIKLKTYSVWPMSQGHCYVAQQIEVRWLHCQNTVPNIM